MSRLYIMVPHCCIAHCLVSKELSLLEIISIHYRKTSPIWSAYSKFQMALICLEIPGKRSHKQLRANYPEPFALNNGTEDHLFSSPAGSTASQHDQRV